MAMGNAPVEVATADGASFNQQAMASQSDAAPGLDTPAARKALVNRICREVLAGKKRHESAFKRMKDDMKFLRKQWPGEGDEDDRYKLNIVQRYVNQRVSSLYAKNPKAVARRRPRMNFKLWDEKPESMQAAMQTLSGAQQAAQEAAQAGDPHAPVAHQMAQNDPAIQMAQALIQDIVQGAQERALYDKVAKTLELLYGHFVDHQQPRFKGRLKKAVKRAVTCGVSYIKMGFIREMGRPPGYEQNLAAMSLRLAHIQEMAKDLAKGEIDTTDAEAEELKLAIAALHAAPEIILRAGLTFDFPLSTRIIPDPKCTQLVDFVGADWVAEELIMSKDQIADTYGVELGSSFTQYSEDHTPALRQTSWGNLKIEDKKDGDLACVWEFYDKRTGLQYCVVDGYPDFLKEPAAPQLNLERFFPFWPLVFNEMETEDSIFPDSDVRLLRSPQTEYNRSKEALRQHRIAAAPRYVTPWGTFDKEDDQSLATLRPHHTIQLKGLGENQDVGKLLQRVPTAAIDPNLYETGTIMEDAMRATGSQPATIGGTSGDTATEVSVAEGSRAEASGSNGDDLDDMLTDLARCAGQVLFTEMDADQVMEIVGPGAAWPTLNADAISKEIYLEIEAGSSGAPNKSIDMANFQRMVPFLVQSPGINPMWLLKYAIKIMDDRMDVTDAVLDNAPSIQAQNAVASRPPQALPAPGAPGPANSAAPGAQGAQGGNNAPQPPGQAPGPQAAHPAPGQATAYDHNGQRMMPA